MSTLICFATLENDLPPWPISTKIYLPQDKGGVTICTLAIPKYTLSKKIRLMRLKSSRCQNYSKNILG